MKLKVEVGEYEVLGHGTIVSVPNMPIRFQMDDLTFEFHFLDDDKNPEMKLNAEVSDDRKTMVFMFLNFNNPLGTGNVHPIKLASLNGKELYLLYRIYALTEVGKEPAGRTIHYTWFSKKIDK